ncbi:fasciclin domain-containing protein [Pontibacter liquoris]|uniref:fasciclin domain-containing protein n=1 Tax=Pontibacter liquoris TaxID=2905677 RepID=UPI001FA6CBCF|nr:fasciclin domain-containing protein [Pontibacter liquoris]
MKRTKILAYALALCTSTLVMSCGTNQGNSENELQQEAGTNPGSDAGAQQTTPNAAGAETGAADKPVRHDGSIVGGHEMMPSQSIVENITANPDLTTLASVLRQAGLVQDLSGTGPYTFLAPTNEAFDALPKGTLGDLMKPQNKDRLVAILKNHVIAGKTTGTDLKDGSTLRTMADSPLKVEKNQDKVMVNGAEIEKADIESSNGVIHVINKVLVPAEK